MRTQQEDIKFAGSLILNFLDSTTVRNTFLLFINKQTKKENTEAKTEIFSVKIREKPPLLINLFKHCALILFVVRMETLVGQPVLASVLNSL